jgi:hypothetical protein
MNINKLQSKTGSGVVTIPRDHLDMCGLLDEDGDPKSVQLLVEMEEPGSWNVRVLNDDEISTPFEAD